MSRLRRLSILAICACTVATAGHNQVAIADGFPSQKEVQEIAQQSLQELVQFSNPERGINIKYPKNWEKIEPKDTLIVCKFLTLNGLASYRVAVDQLPASITLADYAKITGDQIKTAMDAQHMPMTLIEEGADELAGVPARKSFYNLSIGGSLRTARVLQYLAVKNNRGYVFNYTADSELYDNFLPVIIEVLKSIELL